MLLDHLTTDCPQCGLWYLNFIQPCSPYVKTTSCLTIIHEKYIILYPAKSEVYHIWIHNLLRFYHTDLWSWYTYIYTLAKMPTFQYLERITLRWDWFQYIQSIEDSCSIENHTESIPTISTSYLCWDEVGSDLTQNDYSLFTPRKPRSLLLINGERGFLRVNRIYSLMILAL